LYRHARDPPDPSHVTGVSTPVVHPAVARAFRSLSAAGVRWCVLRGWDGLDTPGEDVDLLVAPSDIEGATEALRRLGYLRLPSWGRGSHEFFLTYDASSDAWVKLDIVSRIGFGEGGVHETGAELDMLERALVVGDLRHAHPDDAFWSLLLHSLLDRDEIGARRADALARLAPSATPDAPLARWLRGRLPDLDEAEVARAARERDGRFLEGLRGRLRAALAGWPATLRGAPGTIVRRMTKLRRAVLERGLTIALLGIDGAGKSTVATALADRLPWTVRTIYLGLYGAGSRGRPPRGLAGRLRRLCGGYVRGVAHRLRGRFVIYDRFGWDALLGGRPRARRQAVRRWLLAHAIPAPDLVVLLDVPPEVALRRKGEHTVDELRRQRQAYLALAARRPEILVVPADRDVALVARDIAAALWQRVLARRG
jgi:thymidylate kinase